MDYDQNNKNTDLELGQESAITSDALDIIESRNKLWERVMAVALKATSSSDWVDQNGKPYLQASGAEKVARRFGVRIFDVAIEREDLNDEKGRYYLYTVMGKAALGGGTGDVVETIGTCSSRDKFFGKSGGELKAVEDVDIANIKKKAYTNFIGNAITRLLGIRGLTWEGLAKYQIFKDGKTSIKYKDGKKEAEVEEQAKPQSTYEWPKNCGAWDWKANNGKHYVYAKLGKHFSVDFFKTVGMRPDNNDPKKFWGEFSEEIAEKICNQYMAVEESLS